MRETVTCAVCISGAYTSTCIYNCAFSLVCIFFEEILKGLLFIESESFNLFLLHFAGFNHIFL